MFVMTFFVSYNALAQSSDANKEELSKWYQSREWLGGLKLAPHESINQTEFARQYFANRIWWDKAFEFLRTHDLESLEPGSYVIDPGNVNAYVSEAPTKEMDEINWETHVNTNDLQYIIKGKAKMGTILATDPTVKVKGEYNARSDSQAYSVENAKYYTAEPGTFFIFSPKEAHRPAFKMEGYDTVKKILIKIKVPK